MFRYSKVRYNALPSLPFPPKKNYDGIWTNLLCEKDTNGRKNILRRIRPAVYTQIRKWPKKPQILLWRMYLYHPTKIYINMKWKGKWEEAISVLNTRQSHRRGKKRKWINKDGKTISPPPKKRAEGVINPVLGKFSFFLSGACVVSTCFWAGLLAPLKMT